MEDVISDLSRFHSLWIDPVDERDFRAWDAVSSRRLAGLVERLPTYDGAVRARMAQWVQEIREEEEEQGPIVAPTGRPARVESVSAEQMLAGWRG